MPGASTSSAPERRGRGAFSLVEVAVALGVVSFAVIALLGLLSAGMKAGKSSQQDTVLALAARYVLSDLKRQPFGAPSITSYSFDYAGVPTAPAAVALSSAPAFYTCAVQLLPQPLSYAAWDGTGNTGVVGVQLTFTWPGQTATSGPHAEVFHTTLAGY